MPATPAPHAPRSDAESVSLPNDKEAIDHLLARVVAALERHAYPKTSVFAVRLALHEALTNAFVHGHRTLPASTPVRVDYAVDDRKASFTIQDQGPGFKPDDVPDPTRDENLELPSGRGLMLMRAYMTTVRYNQRGNRLEMTYRRP